MNEANRRGLQLSDVAKDLELSASTVSRAISGKGRIGEETRQRVLDYIEKNNYRPNSIARSLAKSRTFNLCVALPKDSFQSELPFFQSALMGACEQANAEDYDVLVVSVDNGDIGALKRMLTNKKVDGVILTRAETDDQAADYLLESGFPFVLIGSSEDQRIPQIDVNNRAASRALCTQMLRKGCKRFALFMGNPNHTVNRARINGCLDALRAGGIAFEQIRRFDGLCSRQEIQAACQSMVGNEPDCIMCGDDYIASRLLALMDRAKDQPQIRVASCFHSVLLESFRPRVPAVEIDARVMGRLAAQALLMQIEEQSGGERRLVESYRILDEDGQG